MNRTPIFFFAPAAAAVTAALTAGALLATSTPAAAAGKAGPQVERGRYLVNTSGCHDCHTPLKIGERGPEPDMGRALSGHPQTLQMPPAPALPAGPWMAVSSATNTAFAGPWGMTHSANLTPDAETGLGRWTERDFIQTIRTGRHLGRGREVLPPMPIPAYRNFTDADLKAIYAYLRTVPVVSNRVPEPVPPAAGAAPVAAAAK